MDPPGVRACDTPQPVGSRGISQAQEEPSARGISVRRQSTKLMLIILNLPSNFFDQLVINDISNIFFYGIYIHSLYLFKVNPNGIPLKAGTPIMLVALRSFSGYHTDATLSAYYDILKT